MTSLSNFVIAVSGTFPGYSQAALKKLIGDNGGEFSPSVKASTTHLVTTSDDFNKNGSKVSAATTKGLPIVSVDWLEASIKKKSAVKTDSYVFGAAATAPAANGSKATISGKKRDAAADNDSDDDDDDKSDAKASSNGRATKKAKTAAAAAATAAPAAKKGKGKAKKKTPTPEPESEEEEEEEEKEEEEDEEDSPLDEVKEKERQKKYKAPVDDFCPYKLDFEVFEDDDNVKFDANLNQTNIGGNNNKFYIAQLLKHKNGTQFATWTHWGRVGENGQSSMGPRGGFDQALKLFEKKFKDKTGCTWDDRANAQRNGKYWYLEKDYAPPEDEEDDEKVKKEEEYVPSKLPESVQSLMQLIFNKDFMQQSMANMNYDSQKLPLGRLSKKTIRDGYSALKEIADLLNDSSVQSNDYRFTELTNRYYTIIPHSFGRNIPTRINNQETLKKEIELVESLGEMEIANKIMKTPDTLDEDGNKINLLDHRHKSLKLAETTPLEHDSKEFQYLSDYFYKSAGHTHSHLKGKVLDIFRIERDGEFDRFTDAGYEEFNDDNRRLLWHGSRATNFAGILSQGLRIAPPEAPVTGYMFGKGVYLADISTKSANYCNPHISNGVALMLLGVAQLGSMYKLLNSDYYAGDNSKNGGHHSTMGQGRTAPNGWMDGSVVHPSLKGVQMPDPAQMTGDSKVPGAYLQYNEYIVYKTDQIKMRYLFKIDFGNARGWY